MCVCGKARGRGKGKAIRAGREMAAEGVPGGVDLPIGSDVD